MPGVSLDDLRRIDELQVRYLDALDRKNMAAWAGTFAEEAQYICTTAENEDAGLPLALMMDDCRGRIEDRVKFVEKVWAGTFQDYQTRHFVQRLACTAARAGLYSVRSNFAVAFTRSDTGESSILAAGVYDDLVDLSGGQALFQSKRVVVDSPVLPHYVVYPL
jgi:anthranilate 1,2-dioxygenase small subunit